MCCEKRPGENKDSIGEISGELICPYPPGIPMFLPGEEFTRDRVDWLLEQKTLWHDQIPSRIRVVAFKN